MYFPLIFQRMASLSEIQMQGNFGVFLGVMLQLLVTRLHSSWSNMMLLIWSYIGRFLWLCIVSFSRFSCLAIVFDHNFRRILSFKYSQKTRVCLHIKVVLLFHFVPVILYIPSYPFFSSWLTPYFEKWMFQYSFIDRMNLQAKLCETLTGILSKEMLSREKCYMLDCDAEVYVWMGRCTSITERKTSIAATEVRYPSILSASQMKIICK